MVENFDEESWNSFMSRTDQAARIIRGLSSNDMKKVKHSMRKADEILGRIKEDTEIIDDLSYVKADRTVINRNALKDDEQNQKQMTPDVFMKQVEADVAERTERRRHNKIESDRHMKQGITAFREKDYDKALSCFNKAIDALGDRPILFLNRALTLLKLGLCKRALKDTGTALLISPQNLKGMMYKAEAHYRLGEYEESQKTIQEAYDAHPDKIQLIKDTEKKWTNAECYEEEK